MENTDRLWTKLNSLLHTPLSELSHDRDDLLQDIVDEAFDGQKTSDRCVANVYWDIECAANWYIQKTTVLTEDQLIWELHV